MHAFSHFSPEETKSQAQLQFHWWFAYYTNKDGKILLFILIKAC